MFSKKLKYVNVFRPVNLLIIVITQCILYFHVIVAFLNSENITPKLLSEQLIYWFITTTSIIAACGYLINDSFDSSSDITNLKHKGIQTHVLLGLYFTLFLIGLGLSVYIAIQYGDIRLSFIYTFTTVILYLYSSKLKNTLLWGNIIVALFSSLVLGVLWYAEKDAIALLSLKKRSFLELLIWGFIGFSFLLSFAREIIKDCEDIKGDLITTSNTFPIKKGINASKKVVFLLLTILASAMAFWIYITYNQFTLNIHLVSGSIILVVLFLALKLRASTTSKDFKKLSLYSKATMFVGLLYLLLIAQTTCKF